MLSVQPRLIIVAGNRSFTRVLFVFLFIISSAQDYDDSFEGAFGTSTSSSSSSSSAGGGGTSSSTLTPPPSRHVVVHLPDLGRVQGKRQSGVDFFGGLPYAAPPVGPLRWAPPEPPQPWAPAKLDATHFGPDCWQLVDPLMNPVANEGQMSEDCLYLNIFAPAGQAHMHGHYHHHSNAQQQQQQQQQQRQQQSSSSSSGTGLLPVLVWLHGGAFQQGGARRPEYDGRRLADRGTIVVTLNYRLGALGFLVSSQDGLFGNFGLMDQRAALHWIQDNIAFFGGDPNNVVLFAESAGAVMAVNHLMMEGAGKLFHKTVIQSNPLGLQFRSVVVADFIGEALKQAIDCRDLACLRAERVEEIMRAQSSLMGVPRSVGDFFTWGPTLTNAMKLTFGGDGRGNKRSGTSRFSPLSREHVMFRDLDSRKWQSDRSMPWAAINVTQPLKDFHLIPDNIPIIIGTNQHEGEMFVHGAFPITMSKAVYWMFVGALFRDSASRVLKHYRGYVDQLEKEAEELARKQVEEEENRQYYLEHREQLENEYQLLVEMNSSRVRTDVEEMLETWNRGGSTESNETHHMKWYQHVWPFRPKEKMEEEEELRRRQEIAEKIELRRQENARRAELRKEAAMEKSRLREIQRKARAKKRALKEAAKVVVDYRPVMSRIIDDYLFRCPAWHLAQSLSRARIERDQANNVYVYLFRHSTHIPGYKECWGKSCHTAEIPYVFQAMDIIRSNYSTLGPYAQREAPKSPNYPYTDMLLAYKGAMEAADRQYEETGQTDEGGSNSHLQTGNAEGNTTKQTEQGLSAFVGPFLWRLLQGRCR